MWGKPFIVYQIEQLIQQGVSRIVCCVGYKGEMIENILGDGSQYSINIKYSYDGEQLLGTGGAIKKAINELGDEFFVLYGDSYLKVNYKEIKKKIDGSGKKGILTIFKNDNEWDSSNIYYDNDRIIAYNKINKMPTMHHIDYGVSLLKSEAFNKFPNHEPFDLSLVYETLIDENQLTGFEVFNRFYEIGSMSGLRAFEDYVNKNIINR